MKGFASWLSLSGVVFGLWLLPTMIAKAESHATNERQIADAMLFESQAEVCEVSTQLPSPPPTIAQSDEVGPDALILDALILETTDDSLQREYTFAGEAGQMIVIYSEAIRGPQYIERIRLYDEADNKLRRYLYHYLDGPDARVNQGSYTVFELPEAGEYRLTISADAESSRRADSAAGWYYQLKVWPDDYYECTLAVGSSFQDRGIECGDAAIEAFSLAIEASPMSVVPYHSRLSIYASILMDQLFGIAYQQQGEPGEPASEDFSIADEFNKLFEVLEPDVQAQIISDLRIVARNYTATLESGEAEIEWLGIDSRLYVDFANYLETGEVSDYLVETFERQWPQ